MHFVFHLKLYHSTSYQTFSTQSCTHFQWHFPLFPPQECEAQLFRWSALRGFGLTRRHPRDPRPRRQPRHGRRGRPPRRTIQAEAIVRAWCTADHDGPCISCTSSVKLSTLHFQKQFTFTPTISGIWRITRSPSCCRTRSVDCQTWSYCEWYIRKVKPIHLRLLSQ